MRVGKEGATVSGEAGGWGLGPRLPRPRPRWRPRGESGAFSPLLWALPAAPRSSPGGGTRGGDLSPGVCGGVWDRGAGVGGLGTGIRGEWALEC